MLLSRQSSISSDEGHCAPLWDHAQYNSRRRAAGGRWGSKVSPKLFVAKEYVLKHIRLKHADKVDAQRERVRLRGVLCGHKP